MSYNFFSHIMHLKTLPFSCQNSRCSSIVIFYSLEAFLNFKSTSFKKFIVVIIRLHVLQRHGLILMNFFWYNINFYYCCFCSSWYRLILNIDFNIDFILFHTLNSDFLFLLAYQNLAKHKCLIFEILNIFVILEIYIRNYLLLYLLSYHYFAILEQVPTLY